MLYQGPVEELDAAISGIEYSHHLSSSDHTKFFDCAKSHYRTRTEISCSSCTLQQLPSCYRCDHIEVDVQFNGHKSWKLMRREKVIVRGCRSDGKGEMNVQLSSAQSARLSAVLSHKPQMPPARDR